MTAIFQHPAAGLAAFVIFSAAGLVGWKLAEPSEKYQHAESGPEVTGKRAERSTRHARSAAADQAGKRMAAIRLAGSPEARMRATVDLAYSLSPAEFAAWMDGGWFTVRGGPELTLFTKIVMERWKLEDEAGLLAWMLKSEDGFSGALNELAMRDPQRVLDHFRENPGGSREMVVLWELAKNHPDLALTRLKEIIDSGRIREVQGYAGELLQNLAEKDPAKLAAAAEGFPAGMKIQAEIALSRERLKGSFPEEIRRLWERPDGWKIFEGNAHSIENVGDKMLAELSNIPPSWRGGLASNSYYLIKKENAEEWWNADLAAAGFSERDIGRLRSRALLAIGQQDPEGAIRRMGELELESSQRESFIHNLFANIRDKEKARELIAQLETEEDRDRANKILDQQDSSSPAQVKAENPADWLAKVAETDPKQESMSYAMFSKLREWDEEKMGALAAGFKSMEADKKSVVARVIANSIGNYGSVSDQLAGDALRHLMENPVPKTEGENRRDNLMEKSGSYVVQLSTRDPAAAGEWVTSLPAGEAKTWTQRNLLNNWRQYDPKAADRWEKSLPVADRAALDQLRKKQGQ